MLDAGSRFLFDYVDRCAAWVEAEHSAARDRALRSAEQQRMRMVLRVLADEPVDEELLGYPLDAHHLALVAWGSHDGRAVEEAASLLGARDVLAVSPDPATTWAWLAVPAELSADRSGALRPPAGTWLAVGGPAAGAGGFRRSHGEALDARRVGRRRPAGVTAYADVGLEALGLLDETRARDFVTRELGSLAGGGTREEILRSTLAAYFACGQNAASTAARLGVHERTITNRLRAVESRLGRSVPGRSAELEMGLRLRELLDRG
jgi:DNA-binding PucR family transcriptional regulator